MPIQKRYRWLYPIDWPLISRRIRFATRGPHGVGRCWQCGRPHGHEVRVLADGRWFDTDSHQWRDGAGRLAAWPDIIEACAIRKTRVILAACHRDHDRENSAGCNLATCFWGPTGIESPCPARRSPNTPPAGPYREPLFQRFPALTRRSGRGRQGSP